MLTGAEAAVKDTDKVEVEVKAREQAKAEVRVIAARVAETVAVDEAI
jgi:hypothetical protein